MPKTTSKRAGTRASRPVGDADRDRAPALDDSLPVLPIAGIEPPDRWAALFDQFDEGNVRVILTRQAPEAMRDPITGDRIKLKGYLEDLPPDLTNYEEYIKERYGGGTYQAVRRFENLFGESILIEIGNCRPKLPDTDDGQAGYGRAGRVRTTLPEEDHDGVNIGGDDDQFFRRMERLLILQTTLRKSELAAMPQPVTPPQDINVEILRHVLSQKAERDDPVAAITRLAEAQKAVIEAMPEGVGGGGGGFDWTRILGTVAGTIGKIVDAKAAQALAAPARRPALPQPTGQPVSTPPATPAADDGPQIIDVSKLETQTEPKGEQPEMSLDAKTVAASAIANIVQIYVADPTTPPADVVGVLDQTLPVDRAIRAQIASFQSVLWAGAKGQMVDYLADFSPEERPAQVAQFKAFFDAVFVAFVDVERVPRILGDDTPQPGPTP